MDTKSDLSTTHDLEFLLNLFPILWGLDFILMVENNNDILTTVTELNKYSAIITTATSKHIYPCRCNRKHRHKHTLSRSAADKVFDSA